MSIPFILGGMAAGMISRGISEAMKPKAAKVEPDFLHQLNREFIGRERMLELKDLVKKLQGNPDLLTHMSPLEKAELKMTLEGATVQVRDEHGRLFMGKLDDVRVTARDLRFSINQLPFHLDDITGVLSVNKEAREARL